MSELIERGDGTVEARLGGRWYKYRIVYNDGERLYRIWSCNRSDYISLFGNKTWLTNSGVRQALTNWLRNCQARAYRAS
jgi:hypothetical protein